MARAKKLAKKKKPISLLRKYRNGQLPDVSVKPSDVLVPLIRILSFDQQFALTAYSEIVPSIIKKMEDNVRTFLISWPF